MVELLMLLNIKCVGFFFLLIESGWILIFGWFKVIVGYILSMCEFRIILFFGLKWYV